MRYSLSFVWENKVIWHRGVMVIGVGKRDEIEETV